jgi:hypothetical protein
LLDKLLNLEFLHSLESTQLLLLTRLEIADLCLIEIRKEILLVLEEYFILSDQGLVFNLPHVLF